MLGVSFVARNCY